MRLHVGLAVLLLIPAALALPDEPVRIDLEGHQDAYVVLEWDVQGTDLTRLDLVRILEGEVEVIPLDPAARSFVDMGASGDVNATYLLYAEFDGGVTFSNAYDASCRFIAPQEPFPYARLQPQCLPSGAETLGSTVGETVP